MKNIKNINAIKNKISVISETVRASGEPCVFSKRLIVAAMAAALAVQLCGCFLLLAVKLSAGTYPAVALDEAAGLARGLFDSGFRFLVLGIGSALAADIIFKSRGAQ